MKRQIENLVKRFSAILRNGTVIGAVLVFTFGIQKADAQEHQETTGATAASEAQDALEGQINSPGVRQRINSGTVGIISDGKFGVAPGIVADLSVALNNGEELRVLPYMGEGSQQNIIDLLYLKGVDIANIQTDVFRHSQIVDSIPNIHSRINYITKLFDKEVHVIARRDIKSIQQLAGKPVSFDMEHSSTSITARILFDALNIAVKPVHAHPVVAMRKLKLGEIAAVVSVEPKPWSFLRNMSTGGELHFLNIDYTDALSETYLPASLTSRDYPNLVEPGGRVDTIAVGSVMAVFNWQAKSDRYRRVAKFVEALFSHFDRLQKPPAHPKWRKVNLAATVPGWTRFPAAQRLLDQKHKERSGLGPEGTQDEEKRYARANRTRSGGAEAKTEPANDREEQLRREFMSWWQQQRTR
jgi:TRAP-type uncharacterized transport system substrate-binding protein